MLLFNLSLVLSGCFPHKLCLHEHQVPNLDSNLDHNPHGRGGLSPDLNPVCLRVNATNLDQDLDQNARVNGAIDANSHTPSAGLLSHTHWECDTLISLPSHSHTPKSSFYNISHSFC